jgi:site-specific DNA-methyltransferase (adenine-specific)
MDCMDGMAQFPDKFFELAIVDPPYGININCNIGLRKGQRKKREQKNWDSAPPDRGYFQELFRVSRNQIIWGGNYFDLPPSRAFVVWDKAESMYGRSFAECEYAWSSMDDSARIIKMSPNDPSRIHPTQKPIALYKWILAKYAKPGDKILDTHVGSASSLIACHEKGFQYVGFELDPDYYRAAKERLDKARAQVSIFDAQTKARAEQLTMIGGGSGA